MPENYFTKLKKETPTRLWINNPTVAEVRLALDHGAVSCTTNPTYGGNMIRRAIKPTNSPRTSSRSPTKIQR